MKLIYDLDLKDLENYLVESGLVLEEEIPYSSLGNNIPMPDVKPLRKNFNIFQILNTLKTYVIFSMTHLVS